MSGRSSNQHHLDLERDRDREARILDLHRQGQTQAAIAKTIGVSPSRVGQIIRRALRESAWAVDPAVQLAVPVRDVLPPVGEDGPRRAAIDETKLVALRRDGLTHKALAVRFGISPGRVGDILKRHDAAGGRHTD